MYRYNTLTFYDFLTVLGRAWDDIHHAKRGELGVIWSGDNSVPIAFVYPTHAQATTHTARTDKIAIEQFNAI